MAFLLFAMSHSCMALQFFMPPPTRSLEALCIRAVCESACASHTLLLTEYLEKYWTYFHQMLSIGAFWGKDEYFKFWGQRSKFKVMVGPKCTFWPCKCAILMITGLNFTRLSVLIHFGTRMNASMFEIKRSKVKVTA